MRHSKGGNTTLSLPYAIQTDAEPSDCPWNMSKGSALFSATA
ncbi:hypothetical protein [uncultured Duncaniella sp.]|nr:hypothetical protein [uncultured Duncaniella sp.]